MAIVKTAQRVVGRIRLVLMVIWRGETLFSHRESSYCYGIHLPKPLSFWRNGEFMATPNQAAQGILGALANHPKLLMKRRILSFGDYYDVMDEGQQVICTVGLDAAQNVKGAMVGAAVGAIAGDYIGRFAQRSRRYTYSVKDPQGNLAMEIRKGSGGNTSQFDIVDAATGGNFGAILMKRSIFGGLKARWVTPDGLPIMLSKGNIIRRKYSIVDAGGRELGRVRHKILAIRDVWQLEFETGSNHLYSALFAIVLDFEKKK